MTFNPTSRSHTEYDDDLKMRWIKLDIFGYVYETLSGGGERGVKRNEDLNSLAVESIMTEISRNIDEARENNKPVSYDVLARERIISLYRKYMGTPEKASVDRQVYGSAVTENTQASASKYAATLTPNMHIPK